ncbi:MAG: type II secretion system secretin GspD [Halofilum sp. (in: g-proteobacteria)]
MNPARRNLSRALVAPLFILLVAQPGHAQQQDAGTGDEIEAESEQGFMLNLQDAELRSLIRTVSERTGRNFIVDPRVDATINVVSAAPVNDRELYDVFLSVLSVHGYATVEEGDVTRIVPAAAATRSPVPVDANGDGQLITRVISVDHVNAAQLVPILRPLMPESGHLAAYEPTGRLIVTDVAANVERVAQIIDRVDRPMESGVDVVNVEHASAQEIVRILGTLQSQQEGGGIRAAADARSNRVLLSGPEEERLRVRTLIANLDTPLEREGNTRVVYLKFGNADELVGLLTGIVEARQEQQDDNGSAGEGDVVIQADANTNSLVLTGPPDRLDGLESIVRRLDIRRAQVLVEAIIVEVSQDQARELGVQFAFDGSDGGRPAGGTSFGSGGSNIVNLIDNPTGVGSGLTVAALNEGGTDFGVLIRALASDANNNILSTPSLMTLDNAEAEIVVGQNVPFVTGQYTGGDADGAQNPFQTIERRDVGITLQVQPQINEGDTIQMDINQEVSSIAAIAPDVNTADVVTNTRSLTTTVLVEDDQTLVLGGLIDDSVQTVEEKVPLLGDIPVLGGLFTYRSTDKVKQNLMVFLHPRIVRDEGLADHYTGEKYSYMRSEQLSRREESRALVDELPTLPELDVRHGGASPAPSGANDD